MLPLCYADPPPPPQKKKNYIFELISSWIKICQIIIPPTWKILKNFYILISECKSSCDMMQSDRKLQAREKRSERQKTFVLQKVTAQ